MELNTESNRGTPRAESASTLRRIAPTLAIALALSSACLFVGCTSSSKGASTKPTAVASASKLDKATTCSRMAAAQQKFDQTLKASSNGDVSTVELITKLDPIRATFQKLAKSTSDATLASLLSSEAKMIDKVESGGDSSGNDTELSIDISSLTTACNSKATTLRTVPQNLQIPGESTTVAAP